MKISKLNRVALEFLKARNFAFLATLNADGSPVVTPTWIDSDGRYVLVNTSSRTRKLKNIERDPRVSISISDQSNPYRILLIQGKVVDRITGKVANRHIDKLARKYMGIKKYDCTGVGGERVLLKILPNKVSGWRYVSLSVNRII